MKSLKEQCANIPESAYHHDSSISPYVVNDLHTALSLIKNDFLDKYLVDIAQTDEKLFIQCSDTLDCLWRVHTRFTETLKEPNIYLQPEVINRPNGYFNYGTKLIYSAEELLKALYERCTGVDLRFDEDKP